MVKMCLLETAKDTTVDSQNDNLNADLPIDFVLFHDLFSSESVITIQVDYSD